MIQDYARKNWQNGGHWSNNTSWIGRFLGRENPGYQESPGAPQQKIQQDYGRSQSVINQRQDYRRLRGVTSATNSEAAASVASSTVRDAEAVKTFTAGEMGVSAWNAVKAGGGSIMKGGMWGAGLGLAAAGAGWVGNQFAPEYVQSKGPISATLTGGAIGLGTAAAFQAVKGTRAVGNIAEGSSFTKPVASALQRFGGTKTAVAMGIGAGVMGLRSIINTSFTRPTN